ncbi:hypothetical protein AB5J72_48050 [Streptomyces sp. CG1]|uniref:hypothetical protein n=1 Tax=Streptomyces sp. CG1 TaxID=1287523 RepID=UPI0034E1D5E7
MNTLSPAETQEALARVREVRLNVTESLRTPWWLWAALGVVMAMVFAANDFASAAQEVSSLGLGVLTVVWVVAGRRSPVSPPSPAPCTAAPCPDTPGCPFC